MKKKNYTLFREKRLRCRLSRRGPYSHTSIIKGLDLLEVFGGVVLSSCDKSQLPSGVESFLSRLFCHSNSSTENRSSVR